MPAIPRDDASDLDWVLFRQDGVISRRQALSLMSVGALRQLVGSGRWTRPHRGIYLAHNASPTRAQRAWIGALVVGRGLPAPLAGISALAAHGIRGYESSTVHVYLPEQMRSTSVPWFVAVHRIHRLAGIDLHGGSPPRTAPARSVIDAARWAGSDDRARAIVAAAFQQRLVDGGAMVAVLQRLDRVTRREVIVEAIRDASSGSESISELDFLRLCRRGRLPTPTRQAVMIDANGRRRYRDAHFEKWGVHVEIDGGQHTEVSAWWADMRRQNAMALDGNRVLRFPAWVIRNKPDEVIATVRAALIAAGWRP